MCGRAALFCNDEGLSAAAHSTHAPPGFHRSFNLSPMRHLPVLTSTGLVAMRWGIANLTGALSINARSETVLAGASPTWNKLKNSQRCAVPVQGFFEWQHKNPKRPPYFIYSETLDLSNKDATAAEKNNSGIMWFAALFQKPDDPGNPDEIPRFVILTTTSENSCLEWLHDRMPVVLTSEEARDQWIDPKTPISRVAHLMKPLETGLKWHEVSPFVNKVASQSIECILPVHEKSGTLFKFLKHEDASAATAKRKLEDAEQVEYLSNMGGEEEKSSELHKERNTRGAVSSKAKPKKSETPPKKKARKETASTPKITQFFSKQ
ncbi:hypothetical protein HDU98_004999 [Podochytrium sp. JEL0797]|nr:hypothetical protein HDU98_004999 [Podochytrium sp. JEL0797]